MRSYLHKSKTSILSSSEIKNRIWNVNLTSAWQERWTVEQRMQTRNTSESDFMSCSKSVQKNKHWNSKDKNIHKLTTCSFEHATEQDHAIQLNQWLNARDQISMQLIHVHLMRVNRVIFRLLIIKKIVLLNVFIQEDVKIQLKCRWCILFFTMTSTSDSIAIAQYHKDQWNQWWEKYRECITNINIISAQRLHLSNKMIKMRNDFQKAESILAMHIRIERIDLNAYLHSRNVSDMNSLQCNCK